MKIAVMTGGTSGLGQVAAYQLLRQGDVRLLLGSRGAPGPRGSEAMPLDLANLASVRDFAAAVSQRIGAAEIDILVLNAGGGLPDSLTIDGFETNFAVNHLAHYLLLRLLLPKLAEGAVVIMTTSGTHDPSEKTVIPPPRHADAFRLARPDTDPERDKDPITAAGRAYASSKLCVVLTARALAASPEAKACHLSVIAYDPGPTPGTRLLRGRGGLLNFAWRYVGPLLAPVVPGLNSVSMSGGMLAELALQRQQMPSGRIYAALRRGKLTFPPFSELARQDSLMAALWCDSAELAGLSKVSTDTARE